MNAILLMLHFLGLAFGFASGIGNAVVMQLSASSPADAPVLGKVPPILARVGQVGLAVLWITGIIMVWTRFGGPANLPTMFWVKLALVVAFTAIVVMMDMTARRIAAGDRSAAGRMPLYGRTSGALAILIVIFAVLAFN